MLAASLPLIARRDERPGDHLRIALSRPDHGKHIGVLVDHDFEERRSGEFNERPEFLFQFSERFVGAAVGYDEAASDGGGNRAAAHAWRQRSARRDTRAGVVGVTTP
ncbi:hypothetical protein OKW35_007417 [Paraburkholderia sp. MM5477-R1]